MTGTFRRVRDHPARARRTAGALSMTTNLTLTLGLAGRETVTVQVPAASGPGWEISGSSMNSRAGASAISGTWRGRWQ